MANPLRHEAEFKVDGKTHVLKWDFGAMAEIEAALSLRGPAALFERLNDLGFGDVSAILAIMSRRGGREIPAEALKAMDFEAFVPACKAIAAAISGPDATEAPAEKKAAAAEISTGV